MSPTGPLNQNALLLEAVNVYVGDNAASLVDPSEQLRTSNLRANKADLRKNLIIAEK
jgi:hypothetical protein